MDRNGSVYGRIVTKGIDMLNYIWAFMILLGVIYAAFTGNMSAVTDAALDSAAEGISLCITMAGVTALWMGLMEIARNAGLIDKLSRGIGPFLTFLFPKIPKDHPSREYIATNMIANFLGLGWAATPAGLKAMEYLSDLEEERRDWKRSLIPKGTASNEMCTFLIVNISSLQLIPVNVIAYRSQYGSVNPTVILAPAILATVISTVVGIVYAKVMSMKKR